MSCVDGSEILLRPEPGLSENRRDRRAELVDAALDVWAEGGYHNLSVRNVARRTPYSHGVVHYYFAGRPELVRECVARLLRESVLDASPIDAAKTVAAVSNALASVIANDFVAHRSAYVIRHDLRSRTLFDADLAPYVTALEGPLHDFADRAAGRYAELGTPMTGARVFAQLDYLIQRASLAVAYPVQETADRLRVELLDALP
ncbi:TetR/AcrR family transcriptional regulator [Flexivirga meconopsidis]|uniref:TetR/AcrR family transcriptional regulator n=1 Tax=Flexivirga meconopsidis TaxID=2977121 RepID=UPI00224021C8|nr:TetR/AcrR family transcriptional regulator [Flexivirga meconopsidis]